LPPARALETRNPLIPDLQASPDPQ
jgi:hypothetical protein